MDDLRAEVGELHRFVVRNLLDDLRLRHAAGIAAHDAVDVGPDVTSRAPSSAPKIDAE
jgi:hypothetical protein